MAPEAANQKRKRGRPANASRDDESAPHTQSTLSKNGTIVRRQDMTADVEGEEDTRPKKRGRKAKAAEPGQDGAEPASNNSEGQPQKRKRGRPSLSQRPQQSGEVEAKASPNEAPEPRKRGKPAAATEALEEEDAENSNAGAKNKPPKKRGRPSLNRSQEHELSAQTKAVVRTDKRGRPPRSAEPVKDKAEAAEEADDENEGNSSLLRRSGRERHKTGERYKDSPAKSKRRSEPEVEPSEEDAEEHEDSSILRRSGRDRRSVGPWYKSTQDAENQSAEEEASNTVRPKKAKKQGQLSRDNEATAEVSQSGAGRKQMVRKRDRRTREIQASEAPTNKAVKKKRGRPSTDQNGEPGAKQKPKSRRQRREEQAAEEEVAEADAEAEPAAEHKSQSRNNPRNSGQAASKPRRRRRTSEEQPESRSSSPEPTPFSHLVSRTRRVTRQTIQEKWSPLDFTSVDSVANILHSATRPVLLRVNNLTKHAQATAALNAISNRLRSKLTRGLPFPPATTSHRREDELDFEHTVDSTQSLEAQLDPLLHSVALLQKEKGRAEKELEREYRILNSLSANAKSEMRGRKEQLRKVHILVPDMEHNEDAQDDKRLGSLQPSKNSTGGTFSELEGGELQALAGQLGNHMESMRGNLQQIEGVTPAIADSRAALRLALLSHLDQEAVDQVLLG